MGNWLANDVDDDILFQGFRNNAGQAEYEKVCLFGLAGSGKSTLYLNLRQMHSHVSDPEYVHAKQLKHCEAIIRSNCLLYIAVLVNEAEKLFLKTQSDLYRIDYENKGIKDAIALITKYIPYKFDQYTPPKPAPKPIKTKKSKVKPRASMPSTLSVVKESTKSGDPEMKQVVLSFGDSIQTEFEQETYASTYLTGFNIENYDSSNFEEFGKVESKNDEGSYLTIDNIESNAIEIIEEKVQKIEAEPQEREVTETQNAAFLMNQYDDYAFYDVAGPFYEQFGDRRDYWKVRYNEKEQKETTKRKYQIEPYKPFNFDAFHEKHQKWKLKQEQKEKKENKDGLKYFDEAENVYDDDWRYNRYYAIGRALGGKEILNEQLIDDFGAYFKDNKQSKEAKPWKKFGHKAAIFSNRFDMKLNDKRNPIKHQSVPSWTHGGFTMKKLDIVLGNRSRIMQLSKYDSDSSDDDEIKKESVILTEQEKEVRYKVDIIDGKIQKYKEWDSKMMKNKQNVLKELGIIDFDCILNQRSNRNDDDEKDEEKYQIEEKLSDENVVEVNGENISIDAFWSDMKKLGDSVKKLWNLPCIQQTYSKRHNLFHFPSNMEYFFYHSTKIFDDGFKATNQFLSLYRNFNPKIDFQKGTVQQEQNLLQFKSQIEK